MVTKDLWGALDKKKKLSEVSDALAQIESIDNNTHVLSSKFDQGRLASVKKDLEKFVISCLTW